MNSVKVSKNSSEVIDLGDKKFHKYKSPFEEFEVKKLY